MKLKALAFDLDDTLIDTSGLLVPLASRAAFEAMQKIGLNINFETFDQIRKIKALSLNHRQIFADIAKDFGSQKSEVALTQAGIEAFYNPVLPPHLPLLPGAEETLHFLKKNHRLFLVTSGAISSQKEKVQRAGLSELFEKCFFVDGFNKGRKKEAFLEIITLATCAPEELMAIGNRLSQEIHDAKEIGAITCYFEYGEHVGEKARNSFEIPDYTIRSHADLVRVCQL
jgi:putative hydrolase of the HAD superfamily